MVFPKPWVKHSLEFSQFFASLNQFIDPNKKTRWQLIQSTNVKYKLYKSQNYLHDCYHSISRTKTDAKQTKRPINKHRVSGFQVITIEQAPRMFYEKGVLRKFCKHLRKIPVPQSLS